MRPGSAQGVSRGHRAQRVYCGRTAGALRALTCALLRCLAWLARGMPAEKTHSSRVCSICENWLGKMLSASACSRGDVRLQLPTFRNSEMILGREFRFRLVRGLAPDTLKRKNISYSVINHNSTPKLTDPTAPAQNNAHFSKYFAQKCSQNASFLAFNRYFFC